MGIEFYDIINKNDETLIKFKLTKKHFNKYGEFIEIKYENLYLYPDDFIRELTKYFTIPNEMQSIGINLSRDWIKYDPLEEEKLKQKYFEIIKLIKEMPESINDEKLIDLRKTLQECKDSMNNIKTMNIEYIKELFNVKETALKNNSNKIRIIRLEEN